MSEDLDQWLVLIREAPSVEDARELLSLFMTIDELTEMDGRVRIIQALLEQELTQREMSSQLGVSIAKITRGSNALKRCPNSLVHYLRRYFLG